MCVCVQLFQIHTTDTTSPSAQLVQAISPSSKDDRGTEGCKRPQHTHTQQKGKQHTKEAAADLELGVELITGKVEDNGGTETQTIFL